MWEVIKKQPFSVLTVVSAAIAIVLSQYDVITPDQTTKIMFGLICLLASTEILDKRKRLDEIYQSIDDKFSETRNHIQKHAIGLSGEISETKNSLLEAVSAYIPEKFESEDQAHQYIVNKISEAHKSILHASVGPSYSTSRKKYKSAYDQCVKKVLSTGRVSYKYVTTLHSPEKQDAINKLIEDERIPKYFVGTFDLAEKMPPSVYFVIIDNEEVIARYPNEFGQDDEYLKMNDPKIVELFTKYHLILWNLSEKLGTASSNSQVHD